LESPDILLCLFVFRCGAALTPAGTLDDAGKTRK